MKNKKIVSFVLAAAMATTVGLAAGCNPGSQDGDGPEKLSAPVVTLSGNVISWNAVDHADAYDVYEGTTVVSDAQTACSYTINKTVEGSYEYTVVATSSDENYTDSDKSNTVTYTYSSVDTSTKLTGKVYLVGDSTVCEFDDKYYLPRYGYGTQLYNYINCDQSQIVNLALSGRSSLSYTYNVAKDSNNSYNKTTESYYEHLLANMEEGDYLIIGFGHNDEKFEVLRYTDPTLSSSDTSKMIGSYTADHEVSFKYTLKHYYIDAAIAKGVTPILCTPVSRLFEDSKKSSYDTDHITTSKSATDSNSGVTTNWNGGNYPQAIKELAEECGILCVDLTTPTKTEYKSLGYDEASKYHAATGAKWVDEDKTEMTATGIDGTHTNLYGAKNNAYYLATALKVSDLPIKDNVKTNNTKPTYEDNYSLAINTSYEIPNQEPFNPSTDASKVWTGITGTTTDETTGTEYNWYATAFGNTAPIANFKITQSSEDGLSFKISADAEKGKIESGGDILAAVFIQVPFKTALTVSATANVTSFGGKQSGFGLMIRDDIYIDYVQAVNSNYVTAGCYADSNYGYMGYSRLNGSLSTSTNARASYPVANSVYELSIARTSQSITAKTNSYVYNAVSDFDLAVSDSEYVYICLWATRGSEVTFSNITFTSGTWVDA